MSSLPDVSPDIFALISNHLNDFDIWSLVLTCKQIQQSLLDFGGVTSFSYYTTRNPFVYSTFKFPHIVRSMRKLSKLAITFNGFFNEPSPIALSDLSHLNSSLTTLELKFPSHYSGNWFLKQDGQLGTDFEVAKLFPKLTSFVLDGCEDFGLHHFPSFPPTLTNLSLFDCRRFTSEHFASLPRGLIHLELPCITEINPTHLRNLPDGLETLIFFQWMGNESDLQHLPRSLTYLDTGLIEIQDESTFRLLPPSVRHLLVPILCGTDQNLSLLPKTVEQLVLASPGVTSLKFVPPSVTKLRFFIYGNSKENIAQGLPTSVTDISGSSVRMAEDYNFCIPSHLKKFCWDGWVSPTFTSPLRDLQAIEVLDIIASGDFTLTKSDVSSLSKCLKSLTISCSPDLDDEAMAQLPRSLKKLSLRRQSKITGKCFKDLPDLETLELAEVRVIKDEDIRHLPRTLVHLSLPFATNLTDACIKDLPRGLKSLDIRTARNVTPKCFKDLPKGLKTWDLQKGIATR